MENTLTAATGHWTIISGVLIFGITLGGGLYRAIRNTIDIKSNRADIQTLITALSSLTSTVTSNGRQIERLIANIEVIHRLNGDTLDRKECSDMRRECSVRICNKLTTMEERLNQKENRSDERWLRIVEHMQRTDDRLDAIDEKLKEHKSNH